MRHSTGTGRRSSEKIVKDIKRAYRCPAVAACRDERAASETLEIIRLVEGSHLSARRSLAKLGIRRTTFYRWYDRYLQRGKAGLQDQSPRPKHVWNRIPNDVRRKAVKLALKEQDCRHGTGGDLHWYQKVLYIRGFCVPRAEGARPDQQPSLHRDQGRPLSSPQAATAGQ